MDLGRRSCTWDTCALDWGLPLGTGLEPAMCIMSFRLYPHLSFFFPAFNLMVPFLTSLPLLLQSLTDFWSLLIFLLLLEYILRSLLVQFPWLVLGLFVMLLQRPGFWYLMSAFPVLAIRGWMGSLWSLIWVGPRLLVSRYCYEEKRSKLGTTSYG